MPIRLIEARHSGIAALHVIGDIADPQDGNIDLLVELEDGRAFTFTAFTPANLARLLGDRLSFVSPGLLVVRCLSDEALRAAVADAVVQGIEQFGVLQRP
jgi:hypothetical protein